MAAYEHTLVLTENGNVFALGPNVFETEVHQWNVVFNSGDVQAVAAGYQHSVVLKKDGRVWTGGHNQYGELGNGNKNKQLAFKQVLDIS